jgi:hypothetical protein
VIGEARHHLLHLFEGSLFGGESEFIPSLTYWPIPFLWSRLVTLKCQADPVLASLHWKIWTQWPSVTLTVALGRAAV